MISQDQMLQLIPQALNETNLPLSGKQSGKVRDWYDLPNGQRLIITTDRLSAFDRILARVPYKGQVLNQLSAWWFEQTKDIIPNHLNSIPDPNAAIVQKVNPLPVEVIVRGYITGVTTTALWYRYSIGERNIYGYDFPEGLRKNQVLPELIITPTTKGGATGHDERLTCAEVVEKGILEEKIWNQVQAAALAIFKRGQELANKAGLILVDTKYEFGIGDDGQVMLIDEIHTPDSSRFWKADEYERRFEAGIEPDNFDKEFIRLAYAENGYRGDGEIPAMPDSLWAAASERYIAIYEMLTGETFEAGEYPIEPRLEKNLRCLGIISSYSLDASRMEFKTIQEISQKAYEFWLRGNAWTAGRLIDIHIPIEKRAEWMARILDVVIEKFEKDESIADIIDFAQNPNKFGKGLEGNAKAAHRVVVTANRFPYEPESFPQSIYILTAHAGKVVYNAQGFGAPFDYHAALTVFEMAKKMAQEFQNEEFETKLWSSLCPQNLMVVATQPIYPKDWLADIDLSRSRR